MRHHKSRKVSVRRTESAAIDGQNTFDAADFTENFSELVFILNQDLEGVHCFTVPDNLAVRFRNIHAIFGEDLRHAGQEARAVLGGDQDRDGAQNLAGIVPLKVDPSLWVHIHATRTDVGMHRDAAPTADKADDRVARQRIAAFAKAHQDIAEPSTTTPLEERRCDLRVTFRIGSTSAGAAGFFGLRIESADNIDSLDLAVSDTYQETVVIIVATGLDIGIESA